MFINYVQQIWDAQTQPLLKKPSCAQQLFLCTFRSNINCMCRAKPFVHHAIVFFQRSTWTTTATAQADVDFWAKINRSDSSESQQEHTKVVEAPGGQALREVGGKQETSEEGEEEVVTVAGQGITGAADTATAQENLQNTFTRCTS